uniref:Uncharacterized protein n=1 Tax=viral metagenome TaxID=1070528 RepID=A0A6M3K8F6_9ZZZZ
MNRTKLDPVKLIRYKTINSCLSQFFNCSRKDLDSLNGRFETKNELGEFKSYPVQKSISLIRKMKVWAWVENKETIHFFVRKNATERDLVHCFSHEIGHTQRPFHKSLIEEKKACIYSKVALMAYDIAKQIKRETESIP